MWSSLLRVTRSGATGAMIAQVWQAAGSFGLQILAAWLLGTHGLGLLSLCLSIIVLATAVASGMVGDSLVILDRHAPHIRAGLEFWTVALAVASFLIPVLGLTLSGLLTPREAVLMGLALVAFQLEELIRRVFMARLRFWRLVVIDSAAVLTSLAAIGVWALLAPVQLATFLGALLAGQIVGGVVGIGMLPPDERALVGLRDAAIRQVAAFGAWRGVQVSVAPAVLTAMRVIVTAAAGAAALGQIELARLFAAPALLALQGLGSYLLSTYVRDKRLSLVALRRRAWRASGAMMVSAALAGVILAGFGPRIASMVTGSDIAADRLAIVGWLVYVTASASLQPFASLAASRSRPAQVLWCRMIDAGFAVGLLVALLGVGASVSWTPFVLAAGLLLGGVLVRQLVLRPLVKSEGGRSAAATSGSVSYAVS